jgi:hypothetical protein
MHFAGGQLYAHERCGCLPGVVLPNGTGCAMSARGGEGGIIVEIDRPGTVIPGRGVVREVEVDRCSLDGLSLVTVWMSANL